jgi:hypothetical protein
LGSKRTGAPPFITFILLRPARPPRAVEYQALDHRL